MRLIDADVLWDSISKRKSLCHQSCRERPDDLYIRGHLDAYHHAKDLLSNAPTVEPPTPFPRPSKEHDEASCLVALKDWLARRVAEYTRYSDVANERGEFEAAAEYATRSEEAHDILVHVLREADLDKIADKLAEPEKI